MEINYKTLYEELLEKHEKLKMNISHLNIKLICIIYIIIAFLNQ